jgi:hypothetical protein
MRNEKEAEATAGIGHRASGIGHRAIINQQSAVDRKGKPRSVVLT